MNGLDPTDGTLLERVKASVRDELANAFQTCAAQHGMARHEVVFMQRGVRNNGETGTSPDGNQGQLKS